MKLDDELLTPGFVEAVVRKVLACPVPILTARPENQLVPRHLAENLAGLWQVAAQQRPPFHDLLSGDSRLSLFFNLGLLCVAGFYGRRDRG